MERYASEDVRVILVGTKCDLVGDKAVPSHIAKEYADNMGWSFFEVSSKESINVDLVFETLTREIIAQRQPKQPVSLLSDKNDDVEDESNSKCSVM